ncbi:Altered inheritance of mitochondria protein 9 [Lachnellula arida]|uniref:Altered inheritance of mitochondria protein 9 n=1 Tax=Lachnellula arida TaxID=1316785 RepID=A0A8T9BAZ1_9HELO|nr:Altered inheritance of mitochondria protein 9 [Lachnellula arida]
MSSIFNSARKLIRRLSVFQATNKFAPLATPSSPFRTTEGPQMFLKRFLGAVTRNPSPDLNQYDEWFAFTRGRFLCDEAKEISRRHVTFDMKAAGSKHCVHVQKFPDGMFNKVFLMTMEDGKEVVVKIPNPNAGQAHFTTASEVATMEFARNVLENPVPKVLAWSSRAKETEVGAEYIIMEKVTGIPLEDVWSVMDLEGQTSIIQTIGEYQKSWMSTTFNQYGSLYFSKDLEDGKSVTYTNSNGDEVVDHQFSIGPTVSRQSNDHGRADISFDRGPWSTVEDYMLAIRMRETTCIQQMEQLPKSPLTLPGPYVPTRARKLAALKIDSQLSKYLIPTDSSITSSHLWHSDLHNQNILVNPDDPTEITGIIDWQMIELAPLFTNAKMPEFLSYEGPESDEIQLPEYPDDSEMDHVGKQSARVLWVNMLLAAYFRKMVSIRMPALYRSIQFQRTSSFRLLTYARNLLVEGETVYLSIVANELESTWPSVPGFQLHGSPPFPVQFSAEEREEIENDVANWNHGVEYLSGLEQSIGVDLWTERGLVHPSKYEEIKKVLGEAKEKALREFATTEVQRKALVEGWPFDD